VAFTTGYQTHLINFERKQGTAMEAKAQARHVRVTPMKARRT